VTEEKPALWSEKKGKMKKLIRVISLVFVLAAAVTTFSGCRTAHGFGEDMQNAGESIQRGTDK